MVALIGQTSCQTWTQLTLLTDPHLLTDNQLELPMALVGLDYSGPADHLRSLPHTVGVSCDTVSAGTNLCWFY